ncbi:MAG: cyclic nucleotide-binding domain-containing protein [Desulfobacterales bacterium]|jgi:PAS domain S-box-containing protein
MLEEVIKNVKINRYITPFEEGKAIFLEGDDSQDLFILVSGQLNVFKGNTKIAEIIEKGSLFGEMSFLLKAKRTATIKAGENVKAIRIPKDEINAFLHDFPEVAGEISKLLAKRLDETSRILYGLKEFCDQLPDAVIATDKEGKIITWNAAAEEVYGRPWDQMCNKSVEEIYEKPKVYKKLLEEVKKKHSVREKILSVRHPKHGVRFISTSSTLLHDDQNNFQGILSLGRDVTSIKTLEKKYRQTRYWLFPSLMLTFLLAIGVFWGHSHFSKKPQIMDVNQSELKNRLSNDYLLLKSMLINHLETRNRSKTNQLMKDFLNVQKPDKVPYNGLVLLDKNKIVFDVYSTNTGTNISPTIQSSYKGIDFEDGKDSAPRVLTLYRADKDHPMGQKSIEIAFEMNKKNRRIGWLIFQLDLHRLKTDYGTDVSGLKQFNF